MTYVTPTCCRRAGRKRRGATAWVHNGSLSLNMAPVQVNSNNANAAVVDGTGSAVNATVRTVGGSFPKAIDLKVPGKNGRVMHGIYQLDQGILTLAVGAGEARPKSFASAEDVILVVLTAVTNF